MRGFAWTSKDFPPGLPEIHSGIWWRPIGFRLRNCVLKGFVLSAIWLIFKKPC